VLRETCPNIFKQSPEPRKARKSVAFTDQQIIVDADGSVTMSEATIERKDSAQSHTSRTESLSVALEASADAQAQAVAEDAPPPEDGGLDLSLLKKKKKKKKVEDEEGGDDAAVGGEDGGLDLTMKKKKKKKAKDAGDEDDFAAKLKELEVKDNEDGDGAAADEQGDMDAGTGIWAHGETKSIGYSMLLQRFFHQLAQKNPDHALSGTKSYKIPPPQCMREGNRKTVFANIADICKRMKRTEEHVTAYLFAELGTNGSVDGSRRLIIKGRFQQKQIENVVRKYISMCPRLNPPSFFVSFRVCSSVLTLLTVEYVTCKTCKSPDTELSKGENRLYFITCNNCGSRRSVTAIKIGFTAQVGKRKKMQ
jgi:translation initiation factor 2 subunit 2